MLAPIEDMTSPAFRTICYRYGADLTFTEMTRVESLAKGNKSTWSKITLKDDTPTEIQLMGAKEYNFKKFLSQFSPSKGFKGFNINLGCPNPKVIALGHGCAMTRRITKTQKIVNIIKDYNHIVSVKLRLGLNQQDKQRKVYLNLINAVDADYFIVHARHGAQSYFDKADFSVYEECVETGKDIIANGDIKTKEQIQFLKSVNVKGAMIGRAAIVNPTIFNELKGNKSPSLQQVKEEFLKLSEQYQEAPKFVKNVSKHLAVSPNNFLSL